MQRYAPVDVHGHYNHHHHPLMDVDTADGAAENEY
jgi:hypothetical protein